MTELRALIEALDPLEECAEPDIAIDSLGYKSQEAGPGTLFVAVPSVGGAGDSGGHRFLAQVRDAGAAVAVVQDGPVPEGLPFIRVADTRAALADLSAAFYDHPSRQVSLFAITGTDGKTTTTYLLEQILASAGRHTGLIGTVEVKIGDKRRGNPERTTTPESLDLQRLLRSMVDVGVTHVAMEASSHALALDRVRGCVFAGCALTNVTADHVEFHGSWPAYFAAKSRLFTDLPRTGPAVLNGDDEHFAELAALLTDAPITYSLRGPATIRGVDVREEADGASLRLLVAGEDLETRVRLPGLFNVYNALAAVGLALSANIPLAVVARGLTTAQPPPGRMEKVDLGQPFDVVVDYAHTPHAFQSVLSGLRNSRHGRVIAVFGAAGNRDRAKRPQLAQIARRYTDFFYITNEDPFGEKAATIIDEIAAGVDAGEEGERFVRVPDRETAIRCAVGLARPGDVVVILGKGHEQSIVVNGRQEPWSDAEVARCAIEERR